MSEKQFPPAQALRAVPLEEAAIVKAWHECDDVLASEPLSFAPALDKVIQFVEQFRRTQLPKMQLTIAGSINEILITDSDVDEEQINLVRLNGRVFSPEVIELDGGSVELPCVKILDEDDLEQIISDSLDMDWKPRDAARAIHAELYGKAE